MTDKTTSPDTTSGQRSGERSSQQSGASGTTSSSTSGSYGSSGSSYGASAGTQTGGSHDTMDTAERDRARRAAEDIKHAARDAAVSTAGAVKNRLSGELDYRKYRGRQRLTRVANVLRETGASLNGDDEVMARYTERAAERVDRLAQYLDQKDVNEILHDARQMARQRPELFVGGLFVAGLMLGRFLRTAKPSQHEGAYGTASQYGGSQYGGYGSDVSGSPGSGWSGTSTSRPTPSGGLVP
jgi:hypothetical protein